MASETVTAPDAMNQVEGSAVEASTSSAVPASTQPTATDPFNMDFWRELCPDMHLCDSEWLQQQGMIGIGEDAGKSIGQTLDREGYIQLQNMNWGLDVESMAKAVMNIQGRGLMPPFCFIYDEFWLMFAKLHPLLQTQLGDDYMMLPDFWAWIVDPRRDDAGWRPHRDKGHIALFPDGRPKALTVWVPLTQATTLNGCMYMVPADRDPTYGKTNDKEWKFEYADIRALPADAGDLFIWNQAVLHWGCHTAPRDIDPRISLAFEFQRADAENLNEFVMTPAQMPGFHSRVWLICKQMLQYQHMYPLDDGMRQFAESVKQRVEMAPESLRGMAHALKAR